MNYYSKLRKTANAYYNRGLEQANLRDLSGAVMFLKKALLLNKNCTDARNLLGLIFYEMGEVSDALIQWIISLNLQPEDNIADEYLDEIQRKPGALELNSSAIKRFNKALNMAQTGGEDFAIIDLTNIVREYPHYIRAQLLLALLYMQKDDNLRAGRALMSVLETDRNNPQALILMDEVKKRTGKAEVENSKLKNAFSHRELEDDTVILPSTSHQMKMGRVIVYIASGLALGLLAFYILLLPGIRRSYVSEFNTKVVQNSAQISDLNASYTNLESRYNKLQEQYNEVRASLDIFEQENADFKSMYQVLNGIAVDYQNDNIIQAAENYIAIDRSLVTVEPLTGMLDEIDRYMMNEGFDKIVSRGSGEWNANNKRQAELYYNMALIIKPDDPEAMYLKARLLQSEDRVIEANEIFDKIIGEHPESTYADRAKEARGY